MLESSLTEQTSSTKRRQRRPRRPIFRRFVQFGQFFRSQIFVKSVNVVSVFISRSISELTRLKRLNRLNFQHQIPPNLKILFVYPQTTCRQSFSLQVQSATRQYLYAKVGSILVLKQWPLLQSKRHFKMSIKINLYLHFYISLFLLS